MTNYSHEKCYANATNNCSQKISGEHIISDNILELFEHNKTVKLTGLSWIENKTFNLLSRKALISNILCTNHNSALSTFDNEAGRLFRCIRDFDSDFNFKFNLVLGKPGGDWGIHRINKILLTKESVTKTLEFDYGDERFSNWI